MDTLFEKFKGKKPKARIERERKRKRKKEREINPRSCNKVEIPRLQTLQHPAKLNLI